MEYENLSRKLCVPNKVEPLYGGVELTGGRMKSAFDNNISFLKRFDLDRMLYWFRVQAGKDAPSAPYGFDGGHFENNLHGQTAGQFLMGVGTLLMWHEDTLLRERMNALVDGIWECRRDDGFLIPVTEEEFKTKEYPNYVRAWLTFGLLAAGYAGNSKAFTLARDMGDWFNTCDVLPYVKDLNLGFQGILANTALYLSPVGNEDDLAVAQRYYREDWWLEQVKEKDQDAIYRKPGEHPHGTLLTTLEGYLDIYRATGEEFLLDCVKSALVMYEDKWQHVGGGIVMCEFDDFFPGCNFLSRNHNYNELCCSTFWLLLNQRMHLLEPDDEHYVGEMEKTIYNILIASQVEDRGIHYLAYLESCKDQRYTDIATCCAGTGTRMFAALPQFLYTYSGRDIYIDLYASSRAVIGDTVISCKTDMPYSGNVKITVEKASAPLCLHFRVPSWCEHSVEIGGKNSRPGSYLVLEEVGTGDTFEFVLPFGMRSTLYTGAEQVEGRDRYAFEHGPLLLAAMGRDRITVSLDPEKPEEWIIPLTDGRFRLKGSRSQEFMAYMDITDQPLTVYPFVVRPE
ncbi:MAG: beta-L-arabinofuranosidase domain-containing protein [Eubacteriales bacterium]